MAAWICLGVIGGYVVVSEVFLRFPRLLHRRLSVPHRPVNASAHRGGLAERPENTLAAFDNAVKIGTHLLELDVHLTKDGQVVVAHDEDLNRVCGGNLFSCPESLLGCSVLSTDALKFVLNSVSGRIAHNNYSDLPRIRDNLMLPSGFHPPNAVGLELMRHY